MLDYDTTMGTGQARHQADVDRLAGTGLGADFTETGGMNAALEVLLASGHTIADHRRGGPPVTRARGRTGGRPPKLSEEQRRAARRMYDERELMVEQIGAILGVSRTCIYRALCRDIAAGAAAPEPSR